MRGSLITSKFKGPGGHPGPLSASTSVEVEAQLTGCRPPVRTYELEVAEANTSVVTHEDGLCPQINAVGHRPLRKGRWEAILALSPLVA